LTGGMREFYQHFPTYFEGSEPPMSFVSSSPKKKSGACVPPSVYNADQKTMIYASDDTNCCDAAGSGTNSRLNTSDLSAPTSARLRLHNAATPSSSRGRTGPSDGRSVSAMSGNTNASVAESIISRASARKGKL
jgi:hypothetical protein